MNTEAKILIMQAFVDGKTIINNKTGNRAPIPAWNWQEHDYSIKPEPKVIYVNEYMTGTHVYGSRECAETAADKSCNSPARIAVKFKEVIE